MADITHVSYLFDPLCGWCYGASTKLEQLLARPDIALHLVPTGLFAGVGGRSMDAEFAAFAWANDQRIGKLSGQSFSEEYRLKVLGDRTGSINSGPATLALTAVSLTAPDREFEALKAIQKARYVGGRDITNSSVLGDILLSSELAAAAERLAASDAELLATNQKRIADANADMRKFGANGVPNLIVGLGDKRSLVAGGALFESLETLVEELKAA
jgi:putative protein-disulfide isomerase